MGYGEITNPLYADFKARIWSKRWERPNNNPRDAFKAYSKLTEAERAACKSVIERCGRAIIADSSEPRFRPMLATWINKRGWEADGTASVIEAPAVDWSGRIAYFKAGSSWPVGWGPRPGDPGCKCPAHVLVGQVA